MRRGKLRLSACGIKPGEHRCPCHEAKPLQEYALRQRPMRYGTCGTRSASEGGKIHMGGDIHRTSCAQRINRLARAHGLQTVAKSAFGGAVIYQQGSTALAGKLCAKPGCEVLCCLIHLAHSTFRCIVTPPDIAGTFNKFAIHHEAFAP